MPVSKRIELQMFLFVALGASTAVFSGEPKEIRITANEFSFKPSTIEVPQGEVKVTVTNRGRFLHGLAIIGRDEKIPYIESGETQSFTINFDKPGEVNFYCPQPGHRNKGMEGKLTVGR
jgi:plastocyanin